MPAENLEHEGLAKNPNLELAQLKFLLSSKQHKNDVEVKQKLVSAIKDNGINSISSFFIFFTIVKHIFICL